MPGNEWQRVTTNDNEWYNKNIYLTSFFAVDDFLSFSLINIPSLIPHLLWIHLSSVLIGEHLIFCSPPWPTCCNSPRKCTPVKYKTRQKVGFPIITYKTSQEKAFLEISQNSQENNCVGVSFLIKLPTKKKRNSGAGAFQWILWNSKNTFFTEHLWASVSVFLSSFSQLALLNEIPTLYFTRKCDTYLWSSGSLVEIKNFNTIK